MPGERLTIHFTADRGDARLRLDQVLVRRVTSITRMSRSRAQHWIESGSVLVDGAVAGRPSIRLREGALVEVSLPDTAEPRTRPGPEAGVLDVLYEDEHLLALNKPPGVVVHPSYKNASGTLLNTILWHLRDRTDARPGIVTRLDKDTSGLLLVSLTPGVHTAFQRAPIRKEYLAIVTGVPIPAQGTIDASLGRDPDDRRRVIVIPDGLPSVTHYQVLSIAGDISLVRCELATGRTHQIRVHMAWRGWPIVGDATYGVADARVARQGLHSWRATFVHPVTSEPLEICAPLPADLQRLLPAGFVPACAITRSRP
jgi:23S rRNA pseudouridine1911/1915/1917 synthase